MTPTALTLVIVAAFIHASWNILLKNVRGGLSFIWFVDILQGLVLAPLTAWVIWSERPSLGWAERICIVGSAVIHIPRQRTHAFLDIRNLFLMERPGVLGVVGIAVIGVRIFFLAGGLQRTSNPNMRAAVVAGLLTGVAIASYNVWDKYVVSVVNVSPLLLDLLASPVQGSLTDTCSETNGRTWQSTGGKISPSSSASRF
jgi:hypothetical protein